MIHILLVNSEKNVFKDLENAFSENKITTQWTDSGEKALVKLSKEKFDLFITHEQLPDMTGRQLIERVLAKNAMMDSVVLSALPHKDFHEHYEGFGVLMQFPLMPGKEQAQNLQDHLNHIARIANGTGKAKGDQL